MVTPKNQPTKILTKDTAVSITIVLALITPLIAGVSFMVTTHYRTQTLEARMNALVADIKIEQAAAKKNVMDHRIECRAALEAHIASGIDGLPHPVGMVAAIKKLHEEINRNTADRWTKADDRAFILDLCRENNLKMVKHERVSTP